MAAQVKRCNICGATSFLAGPGGRRSVLGFLPRCANCQSLERHRTLRRAYELLGGVLRFQDMQAIQFSDDQCIPRDRFKSFTVSVFGGENSQDIQDIKLPDASVDFVACNHVLEHVPDDVRALRELMRIVKPDGALQLGVPDPARRATTEDWGYPRWEDHGHYRFYGMDILDKLRAAVPGCFVAYFRMADPITYTEDIYFVLAKQAAVAEKVRAAFPGAVVEHLGAPRADAEWPAPLPSFIRIAESAAKGRSPGFQRYVLERGYREVEGWLLDGALTTTSALARLQDAAGLRGAVCEIGVHHGRFFNALALMADDAPLLAIDVFEDQAANVDKSGMGDRQKFLAHAHKRLGAEREIAIVAGDSLGVTAQTVLKALREEKVRLFSVDGGHTARHLVNDVRIAEGALAPGGVVIVDDFYNAHWPGVNEGVYQYLSERRAEALVPFCYGDNKLYLCAPADRRLLRALVAEGLLPFSLDHKEVELCGHPVSALRMPPLADFVGFFGEPAPAEARALCGLPVSDFVGSWQAAEPRGHWTAGPRSGVVITLPQPAPRTLTGQIAGLTTPGHPATTLGVWIDGRPRFEAVVHRIGELVNFAVPLKDVGETIRVEFSTTCVAAANELGETSDTRKLGVHVGSLKFAD